jgi:hypothetical protein
MIRKSGNRFSEKIMLHQNASIGAENCHARDIGKCDATRINPALNFGLKSPQLPC